MFIRGQFKCACFVDALIIVGPKPRFRDGSMLVHPHAYLYRGTMILLPSYGPSLALVRCAAARLRPREFAVPRGRK